MDKYGNPIVPGIKPPIEQFTPIAPPPPQIDDEEHWPPLGSEKKNNVESKLYENKTQLLESEDPIQIPSSEDGTEETGSDSELVSMSQDIEHDSSSNLEPDDGISNEDELELSEPELVLKVEEAYSSTMSAPMTPDLEETVSMKTLLKSERNESEEEGSILKDEKVEAKDLAGAELSNDHDGHEDIWSVVEPATTSEETEDQVVDDESQVKKGEVETIIVSFVGSHPHNIPRMFHAAWNTVTLSKLTSFSRKTKLLWRVLQPPVPQSLFPASTKALFLS